MNSLVGPLPKHLYVLADSSFFRKTDELRFEPVVWFGLTSIPGRAWGCTVMTREGAVYRNLPPHALAFYEVDTEWPLEKAQYWNCYGHRFTTLIYPFLNGLRCTVRIGRTEAPTGFTHYPGEYLFSVAPVGDGYSKEPAQAKEFNFVKLDNGRLTIQPTDRILFEDASFTDVPVRWPTNFKRQTEVYKVKENG